MIFTLLIFSLKSLTVLPQGTGGRFNWIATEAKLARHETITFSVALNLRNVIGLRDELLSVSDPKSLAYGKYLKLDEIQSKFGASNEIKASVADYFRNIPETTVECRVNDIITVTSTVFQVENHFKTELVMVEHDRYRNHRTYIRARSKLQLPPDISQHVSFISLNSPVFTKPPSALKDVSDKSGFMNDAEVSLSRSRDTSPNTVVVSGGNEEALIGFHAVCGDGLQNNFNPPCSDKAAFGLPTFSLAVTPYRDGNISLYTEPIKFHVQYKTVFCVYSNNYHPCDGNVTLGASKCYCYFKAAPLPKYQQLRARVYSLWNSTLGETELVGESALFALTDTATPAFLSQLYSMPLGLTVHYGANQSVAEFYKEFYSNSDLSTFLRLVGLPNASIPDTSVFGDLPDDQTDPGGEAQLDVEYIMAMAPNATTYFYSFADLNPYNTANEGFLAYLDYVSAQEYPPLVHSLSYGDVESEIYNVTYSAAYEYAQRCDQEFMKMGLRGLTVLFSSGDDGVANHNVRDYPVESCRRSLPAWPASSPYVTAVGGTQLSPQYLPVCGMEFYNGIPGLPESDVKVVQCTGARETTCSSTIGGIITSGGGFSDVADRYVEAPWQVAAVQQYLLTANSEGTLPPSTYFNESGRGYPDISTYASNYFVYLDGKITRESGTSASAPVFAAMVTLFNDMRAAHGLTPMGFIAPFLYEVYARYPYAFNDITTGNNACGAGGSVETVNCCEYYFSATSGWDPVTGLGSPNFQILANLVLNLSIPYPTVDSSIAETAVSECNTKTETSSKRALSTVYAVLIVLAFIISVSALVVGFIALNHLKNLSSGRRSVYEPLVNDNFTSGATMQAVNAARNSRDTVIENPSKF